MDDPNITMEEYIRLEEEKARKHGEVFNWETAKYDKDNDDNEINMIQSSRGCYSILLRICMCRLASRSTLNGIIRMSFIQECCGGHDMAPLSPRDQRHLWIHYQVEGYTKEIVYNLEQRLETIFKRQEVSVSHAWMRLFEIRAPLVQEFILEFFSTYRIDLGLHTAEELAKDEFGVYWLGSKRVILDKGDLSDDWIEISSGKEFLRDAPSYTYIRDSVQRLCHRLISYNISEKEKAPEKPNAMAGAPGAAEDALVVDEGAQADPAPGRFSTWMISRMAQLMKASGQSYQAFDGTFRGSSPAVFERHTRQRTEDASTSTAPQQPDP
nr:hypothetical protein [Tanacetum cinerariifolium]